MACTISLDPLQGGGFGWRYLGKTAVVDVEGGHGPVSIGLAEAFPYLIFKIHCTKPSKRHGWCARESTRRTQRRGVVHGL